MFNLSQTCSDTPFALWGLFDLSIAPTLLYYAYIPVMVISLFLGVLIFKSERYSLTGGLMFGISLVFTGLLLNEILQWVASPVALVLFGWELIPILRIQLVVLTIYFVSVFIHKKDLSIYQKLTLSFFYISVLILAPTTANVAFFDIDNCEGVPGWLFNYVHILEGLGAVWILFITARQLKKEGSATDEIKRNSILGFGAGLFLIIFFSLTIWGDITTDYGVAIAGSIGMLLFMISITFIIS